MQQPTNQKYIINSIKLSPNNQSGRHSNHPSHFSHSTGRICYDDTTIFGSDFDPNDNNSSDYESLLTDNKVYLRVDCQKDSFRSNNQVRYWNVLRMVEIIGRKIKQNQKTLLFNMVGIPIKLEQEQGGIKKEIKIFQEENIITYKQKQSQKIMEKYTMSNKRATEVDYNQIDGQYASYLTKITENDEQNSQCLQKFGDGQENDLNSEYLGEDDKNKSIHKGNLNKHRSCHHFNPLQQVSTYQEKQQVSSIARCIKKPKSREQINCILPTLIKIQRSKEIKTNLNENIFNLLVSSSENLPNQLSSLPIEQELQVDLCDMLNIVQMANYPPPSNLSLSFNANHNNATNFTTPNTPRSSINHSITYSSAKKNNSSMFSCSEQKANQQSSSLVKSIHASSACRQQKKCIPLSSNYRQYQKEKLHTEKQKQIGQQIKLMRRYTLSHQNSPHKQYCYKSFNGYNMQIESSTYVRHQSQNQNNKIQVGKRQVEENGQKCQSPNYQLSYGAQAINFKNFLIEQRQMDGKNMDNMNPNYRQYLRMRKDLNTNSNSNASMNNIEKEKKTQRKSTPVTYYNSICRPSINVDLARNKNANECQPGQTNRKTIIISKNKNSAAAQLANVHTNIENRSYHTINPASISTAHYNTHNNFINQAQIKPYSYSYSSQKGDSIQTPISSVTINPNIKQHPTITQSSHRNSSKSASKIPIDINKLARKYQKTNTNKSKYQQSQQYLYCGQHQLQNDERRQRQVQSSYQNGKLNFAKRKYAEGSFKGQQVPSMSVNNYRSSLSKNQSVDAKYIDIKTAKKDNIQAILSKYSSTLTKQDQQITNSASAYKKDEQVNSMRKQMSISSQIKQSLASTNFKTNNNQNLQQTYINDNQNIYKNGYPFNKLKSNSFTCNPCQYSQEQQNRNEYILEISKMRKQRQRYFNVNPTNFSQGNNLSLQTYKEQRKSQKTININRLNHTTLNIYTPNSSNKQRLSLSISQNPNNQQYSRQNTDYKKIQPNNISSNLTLSAFEKDYIESKNIQKIQSVQNNLRQKNLEYIYNKSRCIAYDKQKEKQKDKNKKERQIFYTNLRNKDKLIQKERQKEKNKGRDKNYASLIQNYEDNSYKKYLKNQYCPMNPSTPNMSRLL